MAGAAQWQIPCPHLVHETRPADYCMASRVSASNLRYFLKEERVNGAVSRSDLEEWLAAAEAADAALVVCNACDRVLRTNGGVTRVHHPGTCGTPGCDAENDVETPIGMRCPKHARAVEVSRDGG